MNRGWWTILWSSLLLVASACARPPSAGPGEAARFSWRQAEGTTLKVLLTETHWLQVLQNQFPKFEELTGIRLAVEIYPQAQLWDVLETALAEPGRVDVFMMAPVLDGPRFHRGGHVLPLNALMQNGALTQPEYTWNDILPRFRAASEIDGAILSVPVMGEHLGILYRKDVFHRYQVQVPRTLPEFEAAARFLHLKAMGPKNEAGVGVVSRGDGTTATAVYSALLHAMGGTWFDAARRPTINGPQSLAALEFIRRMAAYAPPDMGRYGWQEASNLFTAGRAAMYLEGSSIFPILEQPSSPVAGKVGYALFPSGPGGAGTTIASRSLAIARRSANPHAAWLFLQWATGKDMSRWALGFEILVPRESTWSDRSARSDIPAELRETFLAAGRTGQTQYVPRMVAITSARQAIGEAIGAAFRGEDIRAAADRAAARLTEILQATEP
jgi:multiple sugar transport system substrate-binding protein